MSTCRRGRQAIFVYMPLLILGTGTVLHAVLLVKLWEN